jgi:two-component system, OmpR family, response regulator
VKPCQILIVEDNPNLRSLLHWQLVKAGYETQMVGTLAEAKTLLQTYQPDLVVLDLQLPDGDGIDFCRWLRLQAEVYILILSFRGSEGEKVVGLKAGADDYLAKPFGMQEFLARTEALARRIRSKVPPTVLQFGALEIDPVQRRVVLEERVIDLTPQEFSLLYVLASNPGTAFKREELLRLAWPEGIDNPRTVDTHVLTLRKKIEYDQRHPRYIQTVRSIGYQFHTEGQTT